MKAGCPFLIALMVGVYFGYRQLLMGTEFAEQWWIPMVFAIGAGMLVGNIQGIFLALRQRSALNRPRSEWKDGQLVGVSGRIQAVRSPIQTPFTGSSAVLGEYAIKYATQDEGEVGNGELYSGFLMAPCAISTEQGSVKLTGFPLLTGISSIDSHSTKDPNVRRRAGEYLAACAFQTKASNPMEAIKQLNAVLTDDDGDVKADFLTKLGFLHLTEERETEIPENISQNLAKRDYLLTETFIPNGAEVTAFGSYSAGKQSLDIGSGLSKLSHGIKLGTAAAVTGRSLRGSVIGSLFFLVVFTAGNYYLLKLIGYNVSNFSGYNIGALIGPLL